MSAPVLEVEDLARYFTQRRGWLGRSSAVKAVDGVTFGVAAGEALAIVGESGSGKTTLGRMVVGALEPSRGSMRLRGKTLDWTRAASTALRRDVQMVMQDPSTALNPRLPVARALREAIEVHELRSDRAAANARVDELLDMVELPSSAGEKLPHELSGGQRQRVAIARALSVEPTVVVCDEAVSALDVSIQAQVLNLLLDLRDELGLTYLFITHDLGVVRHFADRVVVMQRGQVVEEGSNNQVFAAPRHEYTQLLLRSVPGRLEPESWSG